MAGWSSPVLDPETGTDLGHSLSFYLSLALISTWWITECKSLCVQFDTGGTDHWRKKRSRSTGVLTDESKEKKARTSRDQLRILQNGIRFVPWPPISIISSLLSSFLIEQYGNVVWWVQETDELELRRSLLWHQLQNTEPAAEPLPDNPTNTGDWYARLLLGLLSC